MSIVVIGDVHGKTDQYQKMLRQRYEGRRTIQVGDMGIGFSGVGLHELPENHKWFRGNHDNPAKCREYPSYMGDFGYLPQDKLFWLAGAWSIDRAYRVEGVSWWADEELSYEQLNTAVQAYDLVKPEFVLSHECPAKATAVLLYSLDGGYFAAKGGCKNSRTSQALQGMLDLHAPKEWVFGHYHIDKTLTVPGYRTKFTSVAELSTYELDTQ